MIEDFIENIWTIKFKLVYNLNHTFMTESQIEQYALDVLANLGWQILHGPAIGPDGAAAERGLRQVVLPERLYSALVRLNPHIPEPALKEAMRRLTQISKPSLIENNHEFHQLLVAGVPV